MKNTSNKFICLSIIVLINLNINAQEKECPYLIKNHTKILPEKDSSSFSILNGACYKYRLFVTGEEHYAAGNFEMMFKLFKHLYYNAGVRILFMECGYGKGILINIYLKTGNERILSVINEGIRGEEEFYIALRKFYGILPGTEKFQVVGIDYEKSLSYTIYALGLLLPIDIPEEFDSLTGHLITHCQKTSMHIYNYIDRLQTVDLINAIIIDFKKHPDVYKKYLKDTFHDFNKVIEAYESGKIFHQINYLHADSTQREEREDYMYQNLLNTVIEYPNVKYYGQFGSSHTTLTYQRQWIQLENYYSLVARANTQDSSLLKSKVCSMFYLYRSPFTRKRIEKRYKPKYNIGLSYDALKCMNELSEDEACTLFSLEGENSPFLETARTKYQYVIVNKFKVKTKINW
jgi:hypothetical protein